MGRDLPPPELADSWGEFHARIEMERSAQENGRSACWRAVAALVFVAGLVCCAYALQGGQPWLWPAAMAAFAVVGVMASRALDNAEREGLRSSQLEVMERAWEAHLERHSPSL